MSRGVNYRGLLYIRGFKRGLGLLVGLIQGKFRADPYNKQRDVSYKFGSPFCGCPSNKSSTIWGSNFWKLPWEPWCMLLATTISRLVIILPRRHNYTYQAQIKTMAKTRASGHADILAPEPGRRSKAASMAPSRARRFGATAPKPGLLGPFQVPAPGLRKACGTVSTAETFDAGEPVSSPW